MVVHSFFAKLPPDWWRTPGVVCGTPSHCIRGMGRLEIANDFVRWLSDHATDSAPLRVAVTPNGA